mgnify:CR=1 FL=1
MTTKILLGAALVAAFASQAGAADLNAKKKAAAAPAPYFLFADTTISYRFETSAKEPAISKIGRAHV